MYRKISKVLIMATVTVFLMVTASFTYAGDMPNGKPFQFLRSVDEEIQLQIDAMQKQINDLMIDVNSLTERVSMNEKFIGDLRADNIVIKDRLNELAALAEAQGKQIDMNSTDIQALMQQLKANNAKIRTLQEQVEDINVALKSKQDILDGKCPDGYFLRAIDPDGSIVCGRDELGSTGLMQYIRVRSGIVGHKYIECVEEFCIPVIGCICTVERTVYPGILLTASCPSGTTVTGGGFDFWANRDVKLYISKPYGSTGWSVEANNYSDYDHAFTAYAVCVDLVP